MSPDRVLSTEDGRGKKLFYAYDPIGRKTEEHQDSLTGPLLTSWIYDTLRKGQLTSTTRVINGANYVTTINSYDNLNQPTRTTYTIPTVTGEQALAGSYQYGVRYSLDNTVQSHTFPAAGGLALETVVPTYNDVAQPLTATGLTSYVTKTSYSPTGKPEQYELSTGGKHTWLTYTYEFGTQRLHESRTDREDIPGVDRDAVYTYYDAGNVKDVTDTSRSGTDIQCFTYDYLQRLTEAWTPTTGCDTPPGQTLLGGPAPYWTSYTYDTTGNRTKETQHGLGVTLDTVRTYTYPDPGHGQHQLASITQTGAAGDRTDTFAYDTAGNTTTRDIGTTHQTLTWDSEDHLATTTDNTGTTSYAYDADGNRLLRRDPTGTTLYLPDMELRLDKTTGQVTATRYYTHNGTLVATRTPAGVQFLSTDPHGTAELSINASDQTETQRRYTPFGDPRGTPTGIWPNDKGFVGGTNDPTGLTQLGAREYDPATGRFISADPIFDLADPQSWNGYTYADNNPATKSDPDGTRACEGGFDACGRSQAPDNRKIPNRYNPKGRGSGRAPGLPGGDEQHAVYATVGATVILAPSQAAYFAAYLQALVAMGEKKDEGYFRVVGLPQCTPGADGGAVNGACSPGDIDILTRFGDMICKTDGFQCHHLSVKEYFNLGMAGLPFALVPGDGPIAGFHPEALTRGRTGTSPSIGCNSFVAGTEVLLANGKTKPIEKIKVGDKVLATDPQTGKTHAKTVTASFGGTNYDHLIKITIDTDGNHGHHTSAITATEHHLFWDAGRRTWTRADHLTTGTRLRTPNGTTARVLHAADASGHPTVRDLTIADLHTYYVEAGNTPVLVHNCGGYFPGHADSCTCEGIGDITHEAVGEADDFTSHAIQRLERRGVSVGDAQAVLDREPFSYYHEDQWKLGYYDPRSKVFVAKTIDGNINTVMIDVDKA